MDAEFWQARWASNQIGFHEGAPNSYLTAHVAQLGLEPGAAVFLPLCGKTHDIDWLLSQGFAVRGIELNQGAVEEVFARLGLTPHLSMKGDLRCYEAGSLRLYAGDFFALTGAELGPVAAIYDRAALVALPPQMRQAYSAHLGQLTGTVPQLLVSLNYDQSRADGPPFAVSPEEIAQHYSPQYEITSLEKGAIGGPLGKRVEGVEEIWHLSPKG
ncbi:MAG: thiopurine S-methyltransferase [Mangrovicoccus sp.]|nr:thiopurine S-methyltransferase [Mangrovicoccus sp.]